jgi:hypothetical protein
MLRIIYTTILQAVVQVQTTGTQPWSGMLKFSRRLLYKLTASGVWSHARFKSICWHSKAGFGRLLRLVAEAATGFTQVVLRQVMSVCSRFNILNKNTGFRNLARVSKSTT